MHLENPEPEILADTAAALQEQIAHFSEEKINTENLADNGKEIKLDKLTRILAATDVQAAQNIISSIKQTDKDILEPMYPTGVTFDNLSELDSQSLKNLFEVADPSEVVLALVGAPKKVLDQFLSPLPESEQQMFRSQLWLIGPTRLSDVEESRRRLVQLAKDLAVQGRVKLSERFYPQAPIPFTPVKIRA